MNKVLTHLYWYGFSCHFLLSLMIQGGEISQGKFLGSLIFSFTSWGGVIAIIIKECFNILGVG